jgi:hypothetical protein
MGKVLKEKKKDRKGKEKEMGKNKIKIHIGKNIYYTEEVISHFNSMKPNVIFSSGRFQCEGCYLPDMSK